MSDHDQKKTLLDVKIGDRANVKKIHGQGALKQHIMDMGITKGCQIIVKKLAPLGDPVEISTRGYELSLRKSECALIEIE